MAFVIGWNLAYKALVHIMQAKKKSSENASVSPVPLWSVNRLHRLMRVGAGAFHNLLKRLVPMLAVFCLHHHHTDDLSTGIDADPGTI